MYNTAGRLQQVAAEALRHFETFERPGGDDMLYKVSATAPEWVQDMVREAHGDMLPDDMRYEYIVDALHAIVDASASAELADVRAELEPDVYSHELIAWFSSHGARQGYADEALELVREGGEVGIMDVLMYAQQLERQEVFDLVVEALENSSDEEL